MQAKPSFFPGPSKSKELAPADLAKAEPLLFRKGAITTYYVRTGKRELETRCKYMGFDVDSSKTGGRRKMSIIIFFKVLQWSSQLLSTSLDSPVFSVKIVLNFGYRTAGNDS
jgi:hypothetical protein